MRDAVRDSPSGRGNGIGRLSGCGHGLADRVIESIGHVDIARSIHGHPHGGIKAAHHAGTVHRPQARVKLCQRYDHTVRTDFPQSLIAKIGYA